MKIGRSYKAKWIAATALSLLFALSQSCLDANPTHGVVSQGSATVTSQGSQLTVTTTGNTVINWATFNIGLGQTTTFVEPSSSSLVWNRITGSNPSQILGNLNANGLVILQNPSGFYVGGKAAISTAGLVMTTSPTPPPEVTSSSMFDFNAPPPSASIINYGQISAGAGGPVFLIAHDIDNHGSITAPGGNIGLYAGKEVFISSRPDGRGLSAQVDLLQGSVNNSGSLVADAGSIALHAQVVNEGGLIQANSVREVNGVIDVVASSSLNLGPAAVISANGDSQGTSAGGTVTLQSGKTFSDTSTSVISVQGGAQGGNGGSVEVSAPTLGAINSQIDGQAIAGNQGGRLLIDPQNITIGNSGTGSAGTGTVTAGSSPSTLTLNVNTAFTGFSLIDLQASQNITISDNVTWDLAASTGVTAGGQLILEAGGNISVGTSRGATIMADPGWSMTLEAGRNFNVANTVVAGVPNTAAQGTVTSGTGNITLAGTGTLQSQNGGITLLAGNSITVNTGAIRTVAGGSIDATAISGGVNTGRDTTGYTFGLTGYSVSPNIGGISTVAGGNVNIAAGGDVTSYLPTATTTSPTDAGSGAFGPDPGIVTVTAGGNVYGHFVAADSVANGVLVASTITAQTGNAGSANNLLALSLVKGGWQVNAPNGSIYLQEVRNPNGVFNGKTSGASPFKHLFDYDPNSFATLDAGDAVYLEGTLLPRYGSSAGSADAVPCIYPPLLTINAGAGGITFGNNVILYPSPNGELNITTTAGGSLEGAGYSLSMSDSGATSWNNSSDFATDHAAIPVELNNPNPAIFNISGDLDDLAITMPKETQITVGGNMNNTSLSAQNLHSSDVTSINVAGNIFNQNTYAFETLTGSGLALPPLRFPGDTPDYLQVLDNAVVPGSGPSSANGGALFPNLSLFYLPATQQLGYYGIMSTATEQLLTSPMQVKTYLPDGQAAVNNQGEYVTQSATFAASASAISALYAASQNSISPINAPLGYQVGGPGQFNVTAQTLDLGVSGGLISEGPAANPFLAPLSTVGATINIHLTGDLDLFASQISSYYGGAININAGGEINAGLQDLPFSPPFVPHGIWTSGDSDINVVAAGDINVAGSRIAAFDGGNIFVESTDGNVDAGTGNFSEVKVNEVVVNPVTFAVTTPQQPIAGSGILATTLPNAPINQAVGNITVETPRGNINASLGGISQEPLNGNPSLAPTLTLTAGTRNANGSVLYAGNINAGNSGVIGINTTLNAAGNISGLVIARGNSDINAAANVSGTFLAGGASSFNATGTITGVAIAGGSINVGGGAKFEGVALSQSVSGGGAQSSLASTATASTASTGAAAQGADQQKAETSDAQPATDDDLKKRIAKPLLVKYTGRVTVILPPKNN